MIMIEKEVIFLPKLNIIKFIKNKNKYIIKLVCVEVMLVKSMNHARK